MPKKSAAGAKGALRPLSEAPPRLRQAIANIQEGLRATAKRPRREMVSIRLDGHIVDAYRATGPGWQGRMRDTIAAHAPGKSAK